ncbi:class I SAM-dependent methyltransferase [Marilutibacter alkalisoli]|nr:class I SAM-dependent methyltransferase [Lysobacter alkalisoli]
MTTDRVVPGFVYRHRYLAKQLLAFINRHAPAFLSRKLSSIAGKVSFRVVPEYQGETLPPIFHYWSRRNVAPLLARFGYDSPDGLYFSEIRKWADSSGSDEVSIASFGSGAGALELDLLARLKAVGVNANILCIDFNRHLKERAEKAATERGLNGNFRFLVADCNSVGASVVGRHQIIIVNQFFHHVENMEGFCSMLRQVLEPGGAALTCDVVGRNGHALWPSVSERVQAVWEKLSPDRQFDRYFSARKRRYISVDHSAYSNEGIRAQDVVCELVKHFDFELFLTYGGAVMPFVERRVGFNFDPENSDDRAFIDQVADADNAAIDSGVYPASNMIAVLRHAGMGGAMKHFPIDPSMHIKATRSELARTLA